MKQKLFLTTLLTFLMAFSALVFRAQASPAGQLPQFATPTPGADGRIVYVVGPGQTCIQISLLTGVPVDMLRTLNQLDATCTLTEGQQLILGIAGPASPPTLSGPTITPTPAEATPTPKPGSAKVCMLLYQDLNGDALRQDTENAIAEGAISITGASGQFSQALATQGGADPTCITNVPEGDYTLSAAAPQGYFPTSAQSFTLKITAGETLYVDFGAQKGGAVAAAPGESAASPIIGLAGGGLLLAALGLGFYAWRTYGRKPPMQNTPKPPAIIR